MRRLSTLALLAILALTLGQTLGLFGPAYEDDCAECADAGCTVLCAFCACCTGALAGEGTPSLRIAPGRSTPPPHRLRLPPAVDPRGILHVPRPA